MNLKRCIIPACILLVAAIFLLILWLTPEPEPLLDGRPGSWWIETITYGEEEQIAQWCEFGEDGVRVLVTALNGARRPGDKFYRRVYAMMERFLPEVTRRALRPAPVHYNRGTRARITYVLAGLEDFPELVIPAMLRSFRDDHASVRMLAVSYFTRGENDTAPLATMERRTKRKVLRELLPLMSDPSSGVRNNAALALGYFPEEAGPVAAALIPALRDPDARVRVVAAGSLQKVSPDEAVKAGVIPVLIRILEEEDDQIGYRAVEFLGLYAQETELTMPALLAALDHESGLIRSYAAIALGNFPAFASDIVPILRADHDSDEPKISRWASGRTLRKLDPGIGEAP